MENSSLEWDLRDRSARKDGLVHLPGFSQGDSDCHSYAAPASENEGDLAIKFE
jgi:hypothetical protein